MGNKLAINKKSLLELIYQVRYYSISEQLSEVERLKSLSDQELREWQKKRSLEIAKHHYENSAVYKRLVGSKFPADWDSLPYTDKSCFQGAFDSSLSISHKGQKLYIGKTSGSTGSPFKFAKDYKTQARVWAYKKYFFNLHGVSLHSFEARFYRMPVDFKPRIIEKLKDFLLRRKRFPVNKMSDDIFKSWLSQFSKTPFEYVYGYSSSIALFSKYLIENNIVIKELCPTLKVVIVTSETCLPEDKNIIEQAFGVSAVNEYGTADVGLIGYECDHGNIHLAEENVLVEFNQNQELVITDLFNSVFPFIRFKLGDMATLGEGNCTCGIHGRFINNLKGRVNDFILLENGKQISGYSYFQYLRPILEKINGLREYKIRQVAFDQIIVDIVHTGSKVDSSIRQQLYVSNAKFFENYSINLTLNSVDRMHRTKSGKLKHFERCF